MPHPHSQKEYIGTIHVVFREKDQLLWTPRRASLSVRERVEIILRIDTHWEAYVLHEIIVGWFVCCFEQNKT